MAIIQPHYVLRLSSATEKDLTSLIDALSSHPLQLQLRQGKSNDILLFIHAEKALVRKLSLSSRQKDWLAGVRRSSPPSSSVEKPLTEAESLRLIHAYIIRLIPQNIKADLFPLHDTKFSHAWLKNWSTKWYITPKDVEILRNHFGEKIALYFAFLQEYFIWLSFPALVGLLTYIFLNEYSPAYVLLLGAWSVVFTEYWKRQEKKLAIKWDTSGCDTLDIPSESFTPTQTRKDPVTGEQKPYFPPLVRLQRQVAAIPFILLSGSVLAVILSAIFTVEVFINELYFGPAKRVFAFTPTVLFSTLIPQFTTFYSAVSKRLTAWENHYSKAQEEYAYSSKIVMLNFLTGYMSLFLTAYVYVPFASVIIPVLLKVLPVPEKTFSRTEEFQINPVRLRGQLIYFAVTAQIVGAGLELFVPYILRRAKGYYTSRKGAEAIRDLPAEHEFLDRVRNEVDLPKYEIYSDYAEMALQYGYITLWSVIWPLVPLCGLVNNFFELRTDAAKLCSEMRRPVPERAESIGPWVDFLSLLTWLGSITSASLAWLFHDGRTPDGLLSVGLLSSVIFAEHYYLLIKLGVNLALDRLSSSEQESVEREEYQIRKRALSASDVNEKRIETVEKSNLGDFWRQGGKDEILEQGRLIIANRTKKGKAQ